MDRVRWPGTLDGARDTLESMPRTIAKTPREDHYSAGEEDDPARAAGVTYGTFGSVDVYEEYVTTDTASGKPELFSANNILAASFGIGLACKKNSYRGTAPKPSYSGGGPGVTRKPVTKPVWFSCVIDGAEGNDDFTGQAVGWTRGKTAWLLVAEDAAAARKLVAALERAVT